RTMSVNAVRSHLAEFGIVVAKGIGRVEELLELAEADATLPNATVMAVQSLGRRNEAPRRGVEELGEGVAKGPARQGMGQSLSEIPGVGKLVASVIAASVPDPSVFGSGRHFAAWLGLTPRQNSTGGKQSLGAITKAGNRYIRKLLVLGTTSLLNVVSKRK